MLNKRYPKNLKEVQTYLSRSVLTLFFLFLLIIVILWTIIFSEYFFNKKHLIEEQLISNVLLYKTNLSEKLGIIASSTVFVSYLRSGDDTRENLYDQFLGEILTLRDPSIVGMSVDYVPNKYLSNIESNTKENVFTYGPRSDCAITVPLCYLNNRINFEYGMCEYAWTLYFSREKLVSALQKINKNISVCSGRFCSKMDLFAGDRLGSFPVVKASLLDVKLKLMQPKNYLIYVISLLTFLFLVALIFLIRRKTENIVNRVFYQPINKMTLALKKGNLSEIKGCVEELEYLNNQIKVYQEEKDKIEVAKIATQAAHDIRSPLAALNTVLKDISEISEQKRILIRNATGRISDIANNLLIRYKNQGAVQNKEIIAENLKAELISSLLESLISEKKIQMINRSVNLNLEIGDDAQGCFVKLDSNQLKRVISNLVNNSVEAIEGAGCVRVRLEKNFDKVRIEVVDNGKGISKDVLPKIKEGGCSVDKKEGFGLGISGAVKNIKDWGGDYDLISKEDEGTTFRIDLPVAEEPGWFQRDLILFHDAKVVILDDDESIHNTWAMRFKHLLDEKKISLMHFYKPSGLIEYCSNAQSIKNTLFLVDYELVVFAETGLDLIEKLNISNQAILVTSRYEEPEIRSRVEKLQLKIIPKNYAPYISIDLQEDQPELIFIDDNKALTMAWEQKALFANKKIVTFNSLVDFKRVMMCYRKDIPIYIDSNLGSKIKGEDFALELYDLGFKSLYLATGFDKGSFKELPWIKEIVSKEPPF